MKRVYCGLKGKLNNGKYSFKVDFNDNSSDDAIQFIEPYYFESSIDDNTYWFGYRFNGSLNKDYRDAAIKYLKDVQEEPEETEDNEYDYIDYSPDSISEFDLNQMIIRSIHGIGLDKQSIDTVVYPVSSTSNLVRLISKCIRRYATNSDSLTTLEVIKSNPANIQIDIGRIERDRANGRLDLPESITPERIEKMIDEVHQASDFSLRRDIHPVKLRHYVDNFLEIRGTSDALEDARNILIVDDFMTTGTTVKEIIRIIRKYNADCSICIFTLVGNNRVR